MRKNKDVKTPSHLLLDYDHAVNGRGYAKPKMGTFVLEISIFDTKDTKFAQGIRRYGNTRANLVEFVHSQPLYYSLVNESTASRHYWQAECRQIHAV